MVKTDYDIVELWKLRQLADTCKMKGIANFLVFEKDGIFHNVDYRYGTFEVNQMYQPREWLTVEDRLERLPHSLVGFQQDNGVMFLYIFHNQLNKQLDDAVARIMP